MTVSESVERFLASGEFDPRFPSWEGNAVERRRQGNAQLRRILGRVVAWRAEHAPLPPQPAPTDPAATVQQRVAPMLRGLFAPDRAEVLITSLPPRVRVVTVDAFPALVEDLPLRLSWRLANLLLDDLGAPPLADDLPQLEGFCEQGHAWVLPRAFIPQGLADTLVHEAAHLLHELPRSQVGLAGGRGRVLAVPVAARETFAWTCEAWACLERLEPGQRRAALRRSTGVVDARVDREAMATLLARCVAEPERAWQIIRRGVC